MVLFGLFGGGNSGNDGTLEVMLEYLRRECADLDVSVIAVDPRVVADEFEVDAHPIRWSGFRSAPSRGLNRLLMRVPALFCDFVSAFRTLRAVDIVIVPGTGILDDFGQGPAGLPYDVFKWSLATRLAGAGLAFVSIGAGPIHHRVSRWLMVGAARLAQFRSYRDVMSKEFMDGAGLDTAGDAVSPDLVFALRAPPRRRDFDPARPLSVGVGVMTYRGWYGFSDAGSAVFETYVAKMSLFTAYLLEKGHDVRLLTGDACDLAALERVQATVRAQLPDLAPGRLTAEPTVSLHDLMGQIAQTDVVVATRYHNVLCALKLDKPVISLGYSKKNDVLMTDFGLGDFCHSVEMFKLDDLISQFSTLVANRAAYEAEINRHNKGLKERLDRQFEYLVEHFIRDPLPSASTELSSAPNAR